MRNLIIISILFFSPLSSVSNSDKLAYLQETLEGLRKEHTETVSAYQREPKMTFYEPAKFKFTGGSWRAEYSEGEIQGMDRDRLIAKATVLANRILNVETQIRHLSASPNCHY